MKCSVILDWWGHPFFKAEPCGFERIEVILQEPSNKVEVKATIPLEDARLFGEKLIKLSQVLSNEAEKVSRGAPR